MSSWIGSAISPITYRLLDLGYLRGRRGILRPVGLSQGVLGMRMSDDVSTRSVQAAGYGLSAWDAWYYDR